jgi:predicted nucleic acid-binding protein
MASTALLVDTNVLSELARPRPNDRVVAWAQTVVKISLSVITLEEIQFGLAWKPNPRVQAWFDAFVAEHCELEAVTAEIAVTAGGLRGRLAARGASRSQADMLIAATAEVGHLTLVTRNVRDFAGCGISLLDPFRWGA